MDFSSDINWFDIFVIAIVLGSSIFAFLKGFIKSLFSLITWAGSVSLTGLLYPLTLPYFSEIIDNDKAAIAVASLGVFIVFFVTLAIIDGMFTDVLDKHRLGVMDRTVGFAFGFLRGSTIVIIIFLSIKLVIGTLQIRPENTPDFLKQFEDASTHQVLELTSTLAMDYLPKNLQALLDGSQSLESDLVFDSPTEKEEIPALSFRHKSIMKKVSSAIPEHQLDQLNSKYSEDLTRLSDEKKSEIFEEIHRVYTQEARKGSIDNSKLISISESNMLQKLFNPHDTNVDRAEKNLISDAIGDDNGGYNDKNIKQLNRLIDSIN